MAKISLDCLKSPTDYLSAAKNVFPSEASLKWYIRRHRQDLIAAGALLIINRRSLIDPPRFDAVVIQSALGRAA